MGVSTIVLARTDAEAANLITSDHDANDKPFLTGERTQEGFYRVKNGLEQAISRGVAYAPYADLVWCETGVPDIGFAREFAQAVHAACPGKLLSYNCSPSFNWKKNLNDSQIASSSRKSCRPGLQVPVHHAGRYPHQLVQHLPVRPRLRSRRRHEALREMVQEPRIRRVSRRRATPSCRTSRKWALGYFDDVTTVIQGGSSSVKALTGSTEEEQFH
jgi:isocitrate lyase